MQKVQTSKRTYSGLSRIRSAGELVVGLDQNNLPYSTAHPKPAGFEYEIAGLLAKELGVRLRVYWAYSSHDSYPSKLSKGLCDVLLGVTPDDRFEHRVQFSRAVWRSPRQAVVSGRGRGDSTSTEPHKRRGSGSALGPQWACCEDVFEHGGDSGSRCRRPHARRLRGLHTGILAGKRWR